MSKTVVPEKLLPDLTSLSPELYPGMPERMSMAQQAQFLDLLCNGASQRHACRVMGIPLLLVQRERRMNPDFADWLQYVLTNARPQALEEIAVEFATRGIPKREVRRVQKPVVIDGVPLKDEHDEPILVAEETVTEGNEFNSHALLQFLLKGQQREKYGTEHKKLEANVNTQPVTIRNEKDAQRLLNKVREQLREALPPIEGEVINDGSDLV